MTSVVLTNSADTKLSTAMTVRKAEEGDAASIAHLWNETFASSDVGARISPYTTEEYLALCSRADLVVAEREATLLGTVALVGPDCLLRTIAWPDEVEVVMLAVAGTSRRRGVARILLAWAHGQAVRGGRRAMVVSVLPDQLEANRLYRSLGYRRWPDRDPSPPNGGPARMVYRLDLRSKAPVSHWSRWR
jgi:ribosomal protein S18 acetylase RimI-like enzyme